MINYGVLYGTQEVALNGQTEFNVTLKEGVIHRDDI